MKKPKNPVDRLIELSWELFSWMPERQREDMRTEFLRRIQTAHEYSEIVEHFLERIGDGKQVVKG